MKLSDDSKNTNQPLTERQLILAQLIELILSWDEPAPKPPSEDGAEEAEPKKQGRKRPKKQDKS